MGHCDKEWRQTQEGETVSALQLLWVWLTAEVFMLTKTSDSAENIILHLTPGAVRKHVFEHVSQTWPL